MASRGYLLLTAIALIALLMLSACGGGDDDDDSDDGGNDPTATVDSGDDGGDDGDDGGDGGDDDDGDDDDGDDDGDDGGDDGGDSTPIDTELGAVACSLISVEDIERVTGVTMGEGVQESYAADFAGCRWEDDEFNSVTTNVLTGPGGVVLYELDLDDDDEDVDGIGDRAHYLPGILGSLEFMQDDYYVSITVSTGEGEDVIKEHSIALGQIAVDNLP